MPEERLEYNHTSTQRKRCMETTEEQEELLAALVERFPDEANSTLEKGSVISYFSIPLHKDRDQLAQAYDELKQLGAIMTIEYADFISPKGAEAGRKILAERHHLNERSSEEKERQKHRRELNLVILGGVIGFVSAILAVYIAHELGWNK